MFLESIWLEWKMIESNNAILCHRSAIILIDNIGDFQQIMKAGCLIERCNVPQLQKLSGRKEVCLTLRKYFIFISLHISAISWRQLSRRISAGSVAIRRLVQSSVWDVCVHGNGWASRTQLVLTALNSGIGIELLMKAKNTRLRNSTK